MTRPTIRVLAAPLMDPGQGRISVELPQGLTIAQMIPRAMPALPADAWGQLRVSLVGASGAALIYPEYWARVRPQPGVRLVIRVVPAGDSLGSILMVVVSVAALALAGPIAGSLIQTAGWGQTLLTGVVAAGLTLVGGMLVSALVPMKQPKSDEDKRNRYTINGWQNEARPDQPIPLPFGRLRYAPPFAATSFTEIVGNDQYIRALFCIGDGPVKISDLRIGETSIDKYDDVEIEIREGRPDDTPLTLYPRQVLEDAANVELVRPKPRNAYGEVISGDAIETPVERWTARDAWACNVIIGFPAGLFRVNDSGDLRSRGVEIRIRQRLAGDEDWDEVTTLSISAKNRAIFFRQFTWAFPARGRWEIEVTRMTDERTDTQSSDKTVLSAIQSIRPEYPLNVDKPLALVAVRIRATYQLNGNLDQFNCLVERYGRHWDGSAWVTDSLSRNPASAFIHALQAHGMAYPVSDAGIDLEAIADWYAWCEAKGLEYNRVHDSDEALADTLQAICAAGRATYRHDGLRWGVIIDRPQEIAVDHLSARNSAEHKWSRTYFDPPHAFRVQFLDETNDYEPAERIIPWPGYDGPIWLTETIELPGKTNPDEIWIEARRRQYELLHRPDTFSCVQSGLARVATRGDLVMLSSDVLSGKARSARVRAISGTMVVLDDQVQMEEGKSYGLRFRVYADADDSIGSSIVRTVQSNPGITSTLVITGAGSAMPAVGELVHFGEAEQVSRAMRMKGVEAGDEAVAVLHMVPDATIIDELTDAEVPPDWSGRVGTIIGGSLVPKVPVFSRVEGVTERTEIRGDPIDQGGGVTSDGPLLGYRYSYSCEIELKPGAGEISILQSWVIEYREPGDVDWTVIEASVSSGSSGGGLEAFLGVPVADGGATVGPFSTPTQIELRARAVSLDGTEGPYSGTLLVDVPATAGPVPQAIDDGTVSIVGGLGHAVISLATSDDENLAQIQLYRVPAGEGLNRAEHRAGAAFDVAPATTVTYVDGDGTRANLLANPGFDSGASWSAEPGWAIAGGVAAHTAGTVDDLDQVLSLTPGSWYRIAVTVSGATAGSVRPRLIGGTSAAGAAVGSNGRAVDRVQANAGNATFSLRADGTFDGSVDDVVAFLETAACVTQGDWDYYVEPLASTGVGGPTAGPFNAAVT